LKKLSEKRDEGEGEERLLITMDFGRIIRAFLSPPPALVRRKKQKHGERKRESGGKD